VVFIYSEISVICLVLSLLRLIAHVGLAIQKYSYIFIPSIFGLKISNIKNVNYWRVLITSVLPPWRRHGAAARLPSPKNGVREGRKAAFGTGVAGRRRKKVALEDRVLRRFTKKNFAGWKKVRTFAPAFERDGSAAKAKKA